MEKENTKRTPSLFVNIFSKSLWVSLVLIIFCIMSVDYPVYAKSHSKQNHKSKISKKEKHKSTPLKKRDSKKIAHTKKTKEHKKKTAHNKKSKKHKKFSGIGGSGKDDLNTLISKKRKSMMHEMHKSYSEDSLASTPYILPAKGQLTSGFGYRISPFTGEREFHKGIDISNREGTPIFATAKGIVSFIGNNTSYGKILIIDHGHGITTRYAHLSKSSLKCGDIVKQGYIIAHMGNSGRSTGSHLHYELLLNGIPINPQKYISKLNHRLIKLGKSQRFNN